MVGCAGLGMRLGAGVGLVAAMELVLAHRALEGPWRAVLHLAPAWGALVLGAAALGAAFAQVGARFFRRLRGNPSHGAAFTAVLGTGLLLWPRGLEAAGAGALLSGLLVRSRLFARTPRLDTLVPLLVFAGAALVTAELLPPDLPDPSIASAPSAGAPVPGSLPVTLTVHSSPDFPEVPAVHPPRSRLAADTRGATLSLWSGVAPARTPIGSGPARILPGGGTLAWTPDRAGVRALLTRLGRPLGARDPRLADRALERLVRDARVPVLRDSTAAGESRRWLRIVESERAPTREEAERYRREGAWIDVRGSGEAVALAFSGEGIRLQTATEPVSVLDVTPTVLHLLGLAVPRSVDGRVLIELLEPAGPGGRLPRYRSAGRPALRDASSSMASK